MPYYEEDIVGRNSICYVKSNRGLVIVSPLVRRKRNIFFIKVSPGAGAQQYHAGKKGDQVFQVCRFVCKGNLQYIQYLFFRLFQFILHHNNKFLYC